MDKLQEATQSILEYINTYGETQFTEEEIKNHLIHLENEGVIIINS